MAGSDVNFHEFSKQELCPLCGKPDYCGWDYNNDGSGYKIVLCQRSLDHTTGDVVNGIDGNQWKAFKLNKSGTCWWDSSEHAEYSRQKWIDEQIALGNLKDGDWRYKEGKAKVTGNKISGSQKPKEVQGIIPVADPNRLDEVYRAFLNLLVLEPEHEAYLKSEWENDMDIDIYGCIMKNWEIKSIPLADATRYNSGLFYKSPWRKAIMEKLIEQVGEPMGVPGFYQFDKGSNAGKWTFSQLSGIVFPALDSKGRIIRLRIRDDFPEVEGTFNNNDGRFSFYDGGWNFRKEENGKLEWPGTIIYHKKNGVKLMDLENKMPPGKVRGKYKNFSSYKEVEEGNIVRNKYKNGCQAGSPISLYYKETDDWSVVYVLEGEKKGCVTNICTNNPAVSLPGVGTFMKLFEPEAGMDTSIFDFLKAKGCQLIVLGYDADKTVNELVLKSEQNAVKAITEHGMAICLTEWNMGVGKGMDDILVKGIYPNFIPVVI